MCWTCTESREREEKGGGDGERGNKECVAEDGTNCRQWLFFILEGEIVNRKNHRFNPTLEKISSPPPSLKEIKLTRYDFDFDNPEKEGDCILLVRRIWKPPSLIIIN